MEIKLPANKKYVFAVSGGVDSMTLLYLANSLKEKNNWQIIVSHINHGIRPDSALDEELVRQYCLSQNLIFESVKLKLKPDASEALSRSLRYQFLEAVAKKHQADAIVTAHHQDDLIETAIINLIRGTGRKGLSAMIDNQNRLRPLLKYSKADIKQYAINQGITWLEDSTNQDTKYLRNYIRLNIVPKLDVSARTKLLDIIYNVSELNRSIDVILQVYVNSEIIDRNWFILLDHKLACEVLAAWLRFNSISNFNKLMLERLAVSAKVARVGQSFPVKNSRGLIINSGNISLTSV
jgi:tRNA(Ile)-lysidine synthase